MILYTGLFGDCRLLVDVIVDIISMFVRLVGGIVYAVRHYMTGGILRSEIAEFCVLFVGVMVVV